MIVYDLLQTSSPIHPEYRHIGLRCYGSHNTMIIGHSSVDTMACLFVCLFVRITNFMELTLGPRTL